MKQKMQACKRFTLELILAFFSCFFVQSMAADKILKVLTIGNSFSEDAVEQNLYELAAAKGYRLVLGNMYIGGCSLERHYNNSVNNTPDYAYRKVNADGKRTTVSHYTLEQAVKDEDWDYVSLQQVSHLSGQYETFQPYLDNLLAYLKTRLPKKTKLIWHMTWAYAQNSTHGGFANYGRNQMQMYNAIVKAAKQAKKVLKPAILVPVGTAIQNARTSFVGDNMNRDGFHLDLVMGRYTAACTWFEKLFHTSVVGNPYAPKGLDEQHIRVAQLSAHQAAKHPFRVTTIK